jgi:hypothetical protein
MIETSDQILIEYQQAKEKGSDEATLDYLLSQYYHAEFQSDPHRRAYFQKLLIVDPLPHDTLSKVMEMEIPFEIKRDKLAFRQWKNLQFQVDIIETPAEELIADLSAFAKNKIGEETLAIPKSI